MSHWQASTGILPLTSPSYANPTPKLWPARTGWPPLPARSAVPYSHIPPSSRDPPALLLPGLNVTRACEQSDCRSHHFVCRMDATATWFMTSLHSLTHASRRLPFYAPHRLGPRQPFSLALSVARFCMAYRNPKHLRLCRAPPQVSFIPLISVASS